MPHGNPIPNGQACVLIYMEDAVILDIGIFPNHSIAVLCPDNCMEPNAAVIANCYIAPNHCAWRKKYIFPRMRFFPICHPILPILSL